jgi:hypothetical protein
MNADELNRLADRCEAASAEQQHDLLAEAFSALTGAFVATPSAIRFMRILGAEAYLDAAMTLVPEGLKLLMDQQDGEEWAVSVWADQITPLVQSHAATPALALTAACLRARSAMEGDE